ncbi:MAG: tRNA (N6-threonylcarbamoyladenosine(37)-N6)-methyltransferase TrmO [Bacteroidales bacterium]|nr:tRNA (N6-threonylcarbamoyladenosine(37)-N6)-methyltransferase TrmO [Bacteroidales bacterium]
MIQRQIVLQPIGIIHTDFTTKENIPRQGRLGTNNNGWVEINPEFVEGLDRLTEYSHIFLIFDFNQSEGFNLTQITPNHHQQKGVFATRSPYRPNPIGLTIVSLERIEGNKIYFSGADMLDGTPLLDIKPYSPELDVYTEAKGNGNSHFRN